MEGRDNVVACVMMSRKYLADVQRGYVLGEYVLGPVRRGVQMVGVPRVLTRDGRSRPLNRKEKARRLMDAREQLAYWELVLDCIDKGTTWPQRDIRGSEVAAAVYTEWALADEKVRACAMEEV